MMQSVTLALLLCTLSTPQLAVASECGNVVVPEEEIKQNAALEHTIANVTGVCDCRHEFDEIKESMKRDLREVSESVKRDLREVSESVKRDLRETMQTAIETAVNTAVEAAVERATKPIEQTRKDVNAARDELNELKESVKRDLREVNATVETVVEAAINTAVEATVEKATKPIEQLLQSLLNDVALLRHLQLGQTPGYPSDSCSEILAAIPSSPSGYYWLRAGNGSSIRGYCDMTRTCGGITGGWMQVANIDMTDSSHTCPQGLKTLASQKRLCGIESSGCSSALFATYGTKYIHICGKVIGYQKGNTGAFYDYITYSRTIDDNYVSGVSLTHGRNPRKHIWTLAAATDESTWCRNHSCPCANTGTQSIPPWVGQDYFCDTAVENWDRGGSPNTKLHLDDPLWDGEGCGANSTCCSFNNPPWFSKQLPLPTTDDIEMRLCVSRSYHDIPVEMIELYVQ